MEAVTPIPKIRSGNEFTLVWSITRAGIDEDLTAIEITDMKLTVCVGGLCAERVSIPFTIVDGNKVRSQHLHELTGTYNLELTYKKSGIATRVDVNAFRIVARSADASDSTEFAITSDIAIGFKGDKGDPFTYDDFTPEQIAELQQPANDAALLANEKAGLADAAATNANEKATLANDAAILANEKAGLANSAAILANEKAGLADAAATNANTKATLANNAALLASEKAGLANTAATNADNARLAIQTDLGLKLDKTAVKQTTGTSTTDVMSQKAVTDLNKEKVGIDEVLTINKNDLDNVKGTKSTNRFDKSTVTSGYFQSALSGNISVNASFFVQDYMPVTPGETIIKNRPFTNSCYFNKYKEYVSAIPSTKAITIPTDVYFIRICDNILYLDSTQINTGTVVLPYEPFGVNVKRETLPTEYVGQLVAHLYNPFVKTQIKLLGDSITAGADGTGFSPTGENIGTTGMKANVLTATCWSNMLYHYIDRIFNRDTFVSILHPGIVFNVISTRMQSTPYLGVGYAQINNNNVVLDAVEFSFYGDHFSVYNTLNPAYGIYDIYVDDIYIKSVDTYNSVNLYSQNTDVAGLSVGYHKVNFAATGTKNASSTNTTVVFEAIKIPKKAIVKPWGISGSSSNYVGQEFINNGLMSPDDNFTIMQFGTNDRGVKISPTSTKMNLVNMAKAAKSLGSTPILMASSPAFASNEEGYYFHMWDVCMAVKMAADELKIPFIDNYHAFFDYMKRENVTLPDLVNTLHPTDLGYKVMFDNVMRNLYLSEIPSDYDTVTYKQ